MLFIQQTYLYHCCEKGILVHSEVLPALRQSSLTMPTQKELKKTRKLKRRQTKVNNRRRNVGKQPLSLKHFYKTSHKRGRAQIESRRDKKENLQSPKKKRKFNNENNRYQPRNAPFGFGQDIDETDPEYQRFVTDLNESDSDDEQSDIDNTV